MLACAGPASVRPNPLTRGLSSLYLLLWTAVGGNRRALAISVRLS